MCMYKLKQTSLVKFVIRSTLANFSQLLFANSKFVKVCKLKFASVGFRIAVNLYSNYKPLLYEALTLGISDKFSSSMLPHYYSQTCISQISYKRNSDTKQC